MNIGLVQMRCEKAALAQNGAEMARWIVEADRRCVDVLAFPEMSLTGYADPTRFPEAVLRVYGPEVASVAALTRGLSFSVLIGLIEANPAGKPFITQIVLRDGVICAVYRKVTIEGDEVAWFAPGTERPPVFSQPTAAGDLICGLAICADIENESVFAAAAAQQARVVLHVAAPGLYGEQATRDWKAGFDWWRGTCHQMLSRYARTYGLWIAVATQAGRTLDEDFPGGGYVFDRQGRCRMETPDEAPGGLFFRLDLERGDVIPL